MLLECQRHVFYGSFGAQNLMVAFIFKLGVRDDQCQVKTGKIRLNFRIQNFLPKNIPVLSIVLPQDSKNVI